MSPISYRLGASIAVAFLATSAFADLSADDVWEDWQAYVSSFGYEVSGTESRSGNVLTVSGVSIRHADETFGGATQITMDQIVLEEQGDGSVNIDLPAIVPVEMTTPSESGGVTRVSLDYRQSGSEIVASGNSDAIDYAYSFETVSMQTTGIEVDGEVLEDGSNNANITVNSLSGISEMRLDSLRRYAQNLQADSVDYKFIASDAASSSSSEISGQLKDIGFGGSGTVPLRDLDNSDIDAMLAAGFSADGTFSYAANAMTLAARSPSGPVDGTVVSGASELGVTFGQNGLTYAIAQSDLQVDVNSPQFPVPLNFQIAQSTLNFALPVQQSEVAEAFAFGFALNGFAISDMMWNMFDPGSVLPRDPATLALDLEGKARLLFDFFDPAAVASMNPEDTAAEFEEVKINRLQIAAAGTELTGDGAFTFNYAGGPFPQPVGGVDLSLTGANALIDKLVSTGLVADEQAMGVRMMMGLLAVPGDAPDTLNSRLEINDQGHVLANGQRIQ